MTLSLAFMLLVGQQAAPPAPSAAPSAPAPIQPASGGGQVGQPPQNSAMRAAGGGGQQAAPVRANSMGMAGMGAGMDGGRTNGLTLSAGTTGAGNARRQGADQTSPRITDTGVIERNPPNRGTRR